MSACLTLDAFGVGRDFPEQKSSMPNKKKQNTELSQEKDHNKSHSKRRIVIEHTICKIKKCRILADIFRNRLIKYNRVSDITNYLKQNMFIVIMIFRCDICNSNRFWNQLPYLC